MEHKPDLKLAEKTEKEEIINRVLRKLVKPILWLLLKTPVTADQVTVFSFLLSITGAVFFIKGGYQNIVIGSLFAFGYVLFDFVDGGIARAKRKPGEGYRPFGKWIDGIVGFLSYPLLIFALGLGLRSYTAMVLATGAIIAYPLQYAIVYFYKSEIVKSKGHMEMPVASKFDFIRYIYGSSLFYPLLLIACITNKPLWLLWFYAVWGNLFWTGIIFIQFLNLKKAKLNENVILTDLLLKPDIEENKKNGKVETESPQNIDNTEYQNKK